MISLHGNSLSCLHLHFHCKTYFLSFKMVALTFCFSSSQLFCIHEFGFVVFIWNKKKIIYCKLEFFPIHFLNVTLFCKCYVCFFDFFFGWYIQEKTCLFIVVGNTFVKVWKDRIHKSRRSNFRKTLCTCSSLLD